MGLLVVFGFLVFCLVIWLVTSKTDRKGLHMTAIKNN